MPFNFINRSMSFVETSLFLSMFEQHILKRYHEYKYPAIEPPSAEYQKLGLEAQIAMGIPQNRHLPIYRVQERDDAPLADLSY